MPQPSEKNYIMRDTLCQKYNYQPNLNCTVYKIIIFNTHRTKGNYSPSKIEEVNQRDAMLSVEPKPISPFSPLTPLSTGIPATNHTMAVTRNRTSDAGSTGSVEVIRVDRLYTSQDVLCTPDNVIYDRIQKKQEFFPPDDYNKCTCN